MTDPKGPVPMSVADVSKMLFREINNALVPLALAYAELHADAYAPMGATEAKVETSDEPDERMFAIAVDQKRREMRSALIAAAKEIGGARNKLNEAMRLLSEQLPKPPPTDRQGRPVEVTYTGPKRVVNRGVYDDWDEGAYRARQRARR